MCVFVLTVLLTGPVCPPPPSAAPSSLCSWSESDADDRDASYELVLTPHSLLSVTRAHTHTHKVFNTFKKSSLLTYDSEAFIGKNIVNSLSGV